MATLLILFILSFVVFALPRRLKALYCGAIMLLVAGIALASAVNALAFDSCFQRTLCLPLAHEATILVDKLSAFFIAAVCVVSIVTAFYNVSYFQRNELHKNSVQLSLHLLFHVHLLYALLLVLTARSALLFLTAWEYMAVCAFFLLLFNSQSRAALRTAIAFFIQMHVGFFLLLFAFALVESRTGSFSFDALASYFSSNRNLPVFLLFFLGFGIKSGFVPLHTWLPETYSQLPASVGGVMSGAVTGMGIYGLLRVLTFVKSDFLTIASILLIVSMLTALYGICMAAVQKDIKRLLGYSSIENMGVAGIGLGLGMLGQSAGNDFLMITGFSGALLHVFSHAVVKSLLFFSVGDVCSRLGTQNLECMGGLMKLMPRASLTFMVGAMAVCALPPFMGFVSEFVLYNGLLGSLRGHDHNITAFSVAALGVLSAAGGVALLAFSKAFGVGFLGRARNNFAGEERSNPAFFALLLLPIVATLLGIFPVLFVKTAFKIAAVSFSIPDAVFIRQAMVQTLHRVSMAVGFMVLLAVGIFFLRRYLLSKRRVAYADTWACGATVAPRVQCTAGAFSGEFAALTSPLFRYKIRFPIKRLGAQVNKLAIFQTGHVHHYILYALLFMLLVLGLTYFEII